MASLEIGTEFDFGGVKERIVTRDDFSIDRARQVLAGEKFIVIGYGVQGPAQSLNLFDNGFDVIVGQRRGPTFDKAVAEGWVPGKNLFPIEEALTQGEAGKRQIQYLLSDAGQKEMWPLIRRYLHPGDMLYFSHGFSFVYRDQTGIIPNPNNDVDMVAPKGAGRSVRVHYVEGRGINSSFAVGQDYTGRAMERTLATGMAIGSGFLFPTTFENEVHSDLTGERGVLLGAVWGLIQAGFGDLKRQNYSPTDAVVHTSEIITQTISRIIGEKGADGLVEDLSSEALQHFGNGFIAAYEAVEPTFKELYERVKGGVETARVLEANSKPDYRDTLNDELRQMRESEIGVTAASVRERRPLVSGRIESVPDAIMAGALVGIMHAQYDLFRAKGHLPSEAFNETVEEATQSLYPMIDERGMDWMYANCSTTAQRGALDWNGRFKEALEPALRTIYGGKYQPVERVRDIIIGSEMWRVGETVRQLRPENQRLAA
ncbi:MAG: ketol-acid reductoisomerase [Patescibacteria group bacterium]